MTRWFEEDEGGKIRVSFAIDEIVETKQTDFQSLSIMKTKEYGMMMALDDFVMLTEADEFVYHEMISHIPVGFCKNIKNILVVGGGDGGTIRELLKYDSLEKVVLCEIDGAVIEASKKYFPQVSSGFNHPKAEIIVGDGIDFVKNSTNAYDLIIVDSADPVGPGEGLFTEAFYLNVKQALRPDGIVALQSESPWQGEEHLKKIWKNVKAGFEFVTPYLGSIPTYPRGLWSFTIGSNRPLKLSHFDHARFSEVSRGLGYLNDSLIAGCFALPNFVKHRYADSINFLDRNN